MGDLLTLETGLSCNNRCGFCPQPPLRACGPGWIDPDTAEMRRRIEEAFARGYRELAFSGGEPTIRPDLAELVSLARGLGFTRVSITTNGRRLLYRDYARSLIEAGLTGVSISLHGPVPEIHDALTGVPGSFRQAVAGLRTIAGLTGGSRERFDRNTITLIVPENAGRLRETLVLAGRLGAGLHVVQPFILSRETLGVASRYLMDREALVQALRAALQDPLPHGGRVKPYNLPPCLFPDLGDRLELQQYGIRTWRMHRREPGSGGRHEVSGQFFRDRRCEGCPARCPGHRLEHLPQGEMVRQIGEAVQRWAASRPLQREWVLSGLDLLGPEGLAEVLHGARRACPGEVRVLWGGIGRTDPLGFLQRVSQAGIDEVCLVIHPTHRRLPDRAAWVPGNLEAVRGALGLLTPAGKPRPSLLFPLGALLDDDWDLSEGDVLGLAESVSRAGGTGCFVAASETLDPLDSRRMPRDPGVLGEWVPRFLGTLGARLRPRLVRSIGSSRDSSGHALEDRVAGMIGEVHWRDAWIEHPFAGNAMGWVSWSEPLWLSGDPDRVPEDSGRQPPPSTTR
ncbi:radical SAM protein [Myxococcota bacterium]|nr:radical SAM protein [Myxococcota bacterium]